MSIAGEKWHSRRKMITPTFHSDLLKEYFQIALREAQVLVSCLRSEVGKPEFDVVPYGKRAALDMICGEIRRNKATFLQSF